MNIKQKEFIIKQMSILKEEVDKKNEIYKHGVDLSNYENGYTEVALNTISEFSGIKREIIEWWLYESSSKIVLLDNKEYDLTEVEDFINFELDNKE